MMRSKKAGLIAVLVMCAALTTAASAMAALPEFTVFPNKFTGTSGTGVLKAGNVTITCTADSGKGEVTGAKSATGTFTFTGCTGKTGTAGESCPVRTPGKLSGEIVTVELTGTLGYVNKAAKTVGIKLGPKTGTNFTEIEAVAPKTCVVKTAVTQSIIGEAKPVNTKTTKGEFVFTETAEKQSIRKFEGEEAVSELKAFGAAARLVGTESITFEKEGELKA